MTTKLNAKLLDPKSWFTIRSAAESDEAEILIYDYIGWGGVTAIDFVAQLKAIKASKMSVRLNTPGGDVFDGLAIYNSLRGHGAKIAMQIDGLAASIGSIIAMAGDTITMKAGTFLMVHNPWAVVIGNAEDMRKMAATLDKVGGSLAGIYAMRPGVTAEQAQSWMNDETWFTASEAKKAGLVDEAEAGEESEEAAAAAHFDLSVYQRVPDAITQRAKAAAERAREHEETLQDPQWRRKRRAALSQRGEYSSV